MSAELKYLLGRLAKASSPLDRLRMAGRAWKQIRRMSEGERAELARGLGIEGAEGLVERLASRSGRLSPAVMMRALEFAKDNDEASIRDVLKRLGSSEGRKELLEEGLERLTAEPRPEPEPAREDQPKAEPRWVSRPKEVKAPPSKPGATGAAAIAAAAAAAGASAATAIGQRRPSPKPERTPAAPEAATQAPTPRPSPSPASRTTPTGIPPVEVSAPEPTPTKKISPASDSIDWTELHGSIGAQSTALGQLKAVRKAIDQAKTLTMDQARQLLETLPSSWMKRRALDAMLEARAIASVADASALIAGLESRASRRWCIGSLLSHWDIDERQRSELLHWRKTGERNLSHVLPAQ